ncbi:hypothetical protein DPSP01_011882 [Paraphaeosphaeria sporulosa]|uniref:HMG box domain-containing protein n=1 Tax=Paraphaeosphaeria sporulosa TaxID=1460663 RepID=A0A177D0Z9_9PLEO|nr:uncharacterized protein CC84DRAFT_1212203 [Paraphaeosphaeria sporulosa]OAG12689.1 hypothetical protein CC84DRAFT_1212203 [Paraphaeosphaeria sporulosa]
MLARGALCRLAADVPKTSTHDLPRISQLLRTTLFARHGASQPTVGAIVRAFRTTILEGRRAYATKSATEPTARVKREVKKAVATKKTAKTTTAKKTTTKKAAPKKAKKVAPKKKKPAKELTAEQKEAQTIKKLKERALLKGSPKRSNSSAWTEFASESLKGSKNIEDSQSIMKEAAVKYKNLTPAEREHYNQLAKQNMDAKLAAYDKWILSHTPEEIAAANYARAALKRKLGLKSKYDTLIDPRHNKAARSGPFVLFAKERLSSGEYQGIVVQERMKLVANEWKALSPSEKKVFEDQSAAAKAAAAKTAA